MMRYVQAVLSAFVLFSVTVDPYTFRRTAGDYVQWGPWWQVALGIVDLLLLVALLAFVWRRDTRRSAQVLAIESLFNIAVAIGLLHRDGIARFIQGFGAEEYLSFYLFALAIRVLLLFAILTRAGNRSLGERAGSRL